MLYTLNLHSNVSIISKKKKKKKKNREKEGCQNENLYYKRRAQKKKKTFRYAEFEGTLGQTYKDGHRAVGGLNVEKRAGSVVETWVAFNQRSHMIIMNEYSKMKEE